MWRNDTTKVSTVAPDHLWKQGAGKSGRMRMVTQSSKILTAEERMNLQQIQMSIHMWVAKLAFNQEHRAKLDITGLTPQDYFSDDVNSHATIPVTETKFMLIQVQTPQLYIRPHELSILIIV
jgi:hypothetical protein